MPSECWPERSDLDWRPARPAPSAGWPNRASGTSVGLLRSARRGRALQSVAHSRHPDLHSADARTFVQPKAELAFSRRIDLPCGVPRAVRSFPRYLAPRLREAVADTPAVLIHG